MYRPAIRAVSQPSIARTLVRAPPHRGLSSVPLAQRPRSWKSSAARWGIAIGAVYWYGTTVANAEEPRYRSRPPYTNREDENLVTVDSVAASRRERQSKRTVIPTSPDLDAPLDNASSDASKAAAAASLSSAYPPSEDTATTQQTTTLPETPYDEDAGAQGLEYEAQGEGAFNEETGEINWDCPCLGGMAHGPCGSQFKEAFSCFVFSKEEPKGIDCVDRFKGMQDCFREHPDVYGAELEEEAAEELEAQEALKQQSPAAPYSGEPGPEKKMPDSSSTATPSASPTSVGSTASSSKPSGPVNPGGEKVDLPSTANEDDARSKTERAKAAKDQVPKDHSPKSESDEMVPKAWHDAR